MGQTVLEHVNYTVSDPEKTAALLCDIFGWQIRWQGPSLGNGFTVHVGTKDRYVALYCVGTPGERRPNYEVKGGLNHIAVLTDDIDGTEKRIEAAGFKAHSHQVYEPGQRFYFHDHDGIEYEVVSYG